MELSSRIVEQRGCLVELSTAWLLSRTGKHSCRAAWLLNAKVVGAAMWLCVVATVVIATVVCIVVVATVVSD
jgi:hypothetical protein